MNEMLLPIEAIAGKLDLPGDLYEMRSPVSAKLNLGILEDPRFCRNGKLVLVTATTPTVSGEGKTVTIDWAGARVGEDWQARSAHVA